MSKRYLILISLIVIFTFPNSIFSQGVLGNTGLPPAPNMEVSGAGSPAVNGIYLTSDPVLQDGVFYYTKVGMPTYYLYRIFSVALALQTWIIGPTLGADFFPLTDWMYSASPPNATPNGLPYSIWFGVTPAPTVGDTPLPVELSLFTVENSLNGVQSKWTTESETENLGFLLERKTEGTDWTEIVSYKTDNGLLGQGTTSAPTDYEYLDIIVEPNTTYEYRLADIDYDGAVTYHSVRTVTVEKAPLSSNLEEFTVISAYPNPFNPSTTITYGLDNNSKVNVSIYDLSGKLINTLVNTEQSQGWHSIAWNGKNSQGTQVPAGIYLSRITSNNQVRTTKLMLLK